MALETVNLDLIELSHKTYTMSNGYVYFKHLMEI